jgi:AcrR family transcriptional regulator
MSNTLAGERALLNTADELVAAVNQNGQRLGAKGRRTRQRLIDVTIDLLETRGLRDLTVAEVARTAETSAATFYVYFEGVTEVVLAALDHADLNQPELMALLDEDWCTERGLGLARDFVQLYCQIWAVNRTVFRVRNLAAEEGDPRFLAARIRCAEPIMRALATRVEAAQRAGKVTASLHAVSTAGAIMTLLERLAAVGPMTRRENGLTFETLIDSSAHMIAHVLGAA